MRKFTLVLALFLFVTFSYAQRIQVNQNVNPVDRVLYDHPVYHQSMFKTEGEVFYSETFDFADPDDERGWSMPEGWQIVDEADNGTYWVWRAGTDSIKGNYTFEPGHRYSLTPEDGYFVLPMDEYNHADGGSTDFAGPNWFQMPSIDCSGRSSVIMKLRQYFRACCGSPNIKVSISIDQGVHWADYNMAFGTGTNVFCEKPNVEVNISDVAAGAPDVWVRFVWGGNDHYFWCVDDFELSEGYTYELQLEDVDVWMSDLDADDGDEGYYYMTPLSQIDGVLGGWTFEGSLLNVGSEDAYGVAMNAEIFKNGTSVHNETSETTSIWALDRDTVEVNIPYFPDDYGTYDFVLTALMEETDGLPGNNVYKDAFHVTDSVYSAADWDLETYSSTASWSNQDGDYLGVVYDISEECEVNSISTMIMQRAENPQASTQLEYGYQAWVFYWEEEEQLWIPLISSEYFEVEEGVLNNWITIPLEKDGESEFLLEGPYIAAIQGFHHGPSGDNNTWRFTLGSDLDHKWSTGKSVWMRVNEETWNSNDTDLSMIRMNLNYAGAPSEVDVVFNCDMTLPISQGIFTPGTDYLDVAGTINGWDGAAHHLEDPDGDGIYSLTVPGIVPWTNIEYKYRINGNWDTSEFPSGGPNRVYMTTMYNMLDDVYNDGVSTVGIEINKFQAEIKVFPNPSNGVVNLEVTSAQAADLNITVSNIQGQEVYRNVVKSAISHKENIDLSEFGQGLYFLKVNDKVTKLIVK